MRHLLEPRLIDPSANEPGLVVELRDERRCLLFDLPVLSALPPRVLLRCSHAFVSHTHMDHFTGFDHLLGVGLGRMSRVVLWGGPGFVDQVEHKLRAYTWNVVQRYEQPLEIEVHALELDGRRRRAIFRSVDRFARSGDASEAAAGVPKGAGPPQALGAAPTGGAPDVPGRRGVHVLHDELALRVRAVFVDHEMPVLAFVLEEKARVRIAAGRLAEGGLTSGPWLATLKQAVLRGAPPDTPIALHWRDRGGEHSDTRTVAELAPLVLDTVPGRRIGYVTDLRGTEANVQALQPLLADVDLLYIESVFADAERDHAARKNHLTARQAGEVARRVGARALVPFHFSPRYQGREQDLVDEAMRAWSG